jgi:hypothetical protein
LTHLSWKLCADEILFRPIGSHEVCDNRAQHVSSLAPARELSIGARAFRMSYVIMSMAHQIFLQVI